MPAESACGSTRSSRTTKDSTPIQDDGVDGWLQAKNEISHLIDESLKLKRTRTHKRIARYRETSEQVPAKAETIEACNTSNASSD